MEKPHRHTKTHFEATVEKVTSREMSKIDEIIEPLKPIKTNIHYSRPQVPIKRTPVKRKNMIKYMLMHLKFIQHYVKDRNPLTMVLVYDINFHLYRVMQSHSIQKWWQNRWKKFCQIILRVKDLKKVTRVVFVNDGTSCQMERTLVKSAYRIKDYV